MSKQGGRCVDVIIWNHFNQDVTFVTKIWNYSVFSGIEDNIKRMWQVVSPTKNVIMKRVAVIAACVWVSVWLILSFSCEVYVKVDPAANVGAVQANVTALLSLTFSYDLLNLTSDPDSISIRPVGMCLLCRTRKTQLCHSCVHLHPIGKRHIPAMAFTVCTCHNFHSEVYLQTQTGAKVNSFIKVIPFAGYYKEYLVNKKAKTEGPDKPDKVGLWKPEVTW